MSTLNNDSISEPPIPAYIFLDEGGNLDFSQTGTTYFTMTSLLVRRPFPLDSALTDLRFDLIETGLDIEYFHASEDRQVIRDKVFAVIQSGLDQFQVDSVIVEKRKTGPALRNEARFFPEMLGYLIRYVVKGTNLNTVSEFIVITDRIPINRKRRVVEKAIKRILADMLPEDVAYRVMHHDSKSCCCLQLADYFNWAIFRAWERQDSRSRRLIRKAIHSQFDIFEKGQTIWY